MVQAAKQLKFELDRSILCIVVLQSNSTLSYNAAVVYHAALARLTPITADQWGLVTRRQAELAGVSRATLQRMASAGALERIAQGVYLLAGAPQPDHLDLRATWLQLAPATLAWERTAEQGVVSHRSAAAVYGLGHLPADRHEFTLPRRRQSRRSDVRLHHLPLRTEEWISVRGLPATRPARTVSDLLDDKEDPTAVAHIAADAIRGAYDYPGTFADALARHALRFGFRRDDGLSLLRWLLHLVGDPDTGRWLDEARTHVERAGPRILGARLSTGSEALAPSDRPYP